MARRPLTTASPAIPTSLGASLSTGSVAAHLLRSLQPAQWTQHVTTFAGPIFGQRQPQVDAALDALGAPESSSPQRRRAAR